MVSGGADSMALLALVSDYNRHAERHVIVHHCHHGVESAADRWASQVEAEAGKRGFQWCLHRLHLTRGAEFERRAREARYAAVMAHVATGDVVMTAHHRDDQIETVVLRLAQGSGLIGLAGIPEVRDFGPGVLVRPLLGLTRRQLLGVVAARGLDYVADPSNHDVRFRRNLIRWKLLPALSRIAPEVRGHLFKLSQLASDRVFQAAEALGDRLPTTEVDAISLADTVWSIAWQVRFFCQSRGVFAPSRLQIDEFARQCVDASSDRLPELQVGQSPYLIRRWQGRLYWVDQSSFCDDTAPEIHHTVSLAPNSSRQIDLPTGRLTLTTAAGSADIDVFFRVQQRSFRLARGRPQHSLKQLGQRLEIPPWLRRQWPLISAGDCILGWGNQDAREAASVSHSLQWHWAMRTMQDSDSTVS
jgi:tRNA(Ile)-lysidine synthase